MGANHGKVVSFPSFDYRARGLRQIGWRHSAGAMAERRTDGRVSADVLHNPAACRILRRAEVGALRGGAEGRPQDGDAEGMRAAEAREDGMVRGMDRSWRMIPGKNNAPQVGSQAGAAQKSTDDSTTFADDARFAARALGAGELFEGASTPRRLLGSLGIAMVGVGWVLLLGIVL